MRAAIVHETALLPEDERAFAQGGAVGEPFDVDIGAVAAGIDHDLALTIVDRLLSGGLLQLTEVPRRFRFRHPVVRRAVYESAGAGWRIGAHRRLAATLRSRGASPAELARHVGAVAEPSDTEAVGVLAAAGRALAHTAPAIAADWYAAALRLLPVDDPGHRRIQLLVPLATSLGAAGRPQESHAALVEALSLLPPGAVAERVRLTAFCGGIEHLLGMTDQAHSRLRAALDALPERNSPAAHGKRRVLSQRLGQRVSLRTRRKFRRASGR